MRKWIAVPVYILLVCSLVIGRRAAPPASAANETVSIWMTTSDRSRLLQQQANVAFGPDGAAVATTIDVNENTLYQTMDGFGSSLTDSSAWLMWNRMSATQRTNVLNALFNPNTGIGLNFLRQTIGASDFSANGNYNYDNTCCNVNDFSIAHELNYNIPILKQIKQINPGLILMASSWSAPGWMKTSNSMIGGGLRTEYYGQFAQYILKFVQAYNAQGLPIYAVTPNNEVQFSPAGYPGMLMSAGEQTNFIKNNLGPTLRGAGLSTKIMVLDHNWDIASYATTVMNDPAAKQYVAGSAMHCYGGTPSAMTTLHNAHPDRDIWVTECSDGTWIDNGSFSGLLRRDMRDLIIGSTRNWSKSVIHWNLALDQNNGPTNGGCTTCYGTVTINNGTGAVTFNAEYYALGHASKFVKQGARRIASNTYTNGIENVAFKNPDGSKVLIAYNAAGSSQTFKVRWAGQAFTYTLPAGAAATFRWSNVTGPTPTPGGPTAVPTATPPPVSGISPTAWYAVINQNSNKCLDNTGNGTANGTKLQQWTCFYGNNQQWQFVPTDSGYYRILNRHAPALHIDVSGPSTANNALVHLWSYVGGTNQQWRPEQVASGVYRFVARHSNRCLDVPAASTADGVQLQQYDCNGSNAQSFRLSQR